MPKVLLVDERREVIVLESIPTQRTGGWLVA
jgi:hypothetical protein